MALWNTNELRTDQVPGCVDQPGDSGEGQIPGRPIGALDGQDRSGPAPDENSPEGLPDEFPPIVVEPPRLEGPLVARPVDWGRVPRMGPDGEDLDRDPPPGQGNPCGPETTPGVPPAEPRTTCSRCGYPLVSAGVLAKCENCGYCTVLGFPDLLDTRPALGRQGRGPLTFVTQSWVFWAGLAAVAFLSLAVSYFVLPVDSRVRDLWMLGQLGVGMVAVVAAQLWLLAVLLTKDEDLGLVDLVLCGRLWLSAFKHLPRTRFPVRLAGWGLAGALCAVFVVGELTYWTEDAQSRALRQAAQRRQFRADPALVAAVTRLRPEKEQALQAAAATRLARLSGTAPRADGEPDSRPTRQCVVIGYQTEEDGVIGGLILARLHQGELRFAGVTRQRLKQDLAISQLLRQAPRSTVAPGARDGRTEWVKPGLFVEVHQSGSAANGVLARPTFKGLLH